MKAATVTLLAIALLAAFASGAITTAATTAAAGATTMATTASSAIDPNATTGMVYNCSSTGNGTTCSSTLGITSCCALFTGTKNSSAGVITNYQSSFCFSKAIVDATGSNHTMFGYKGSLVCVNSGMMTKVTAFIVSLGLLSVFA